METQNEEITGLCRSLYLLEFPSVQCKNIESMPQYYLVQHHGKAKYLVFNYFCPFILAATLTCSFLINLIESDLLL